MPLRIGETFAGYRILRLLGSGGMGEVYLVQHPRLPRHDALKVLGPDVSGDISFQERFIREADLAASLRHPHIVGIHDRGEHDGQLWIAMDYIAGSDAARLVQTRYPAGMPAELTINIINAVASALDYAHKRVCCTETSSPPTSSSPISTTMIDGFSSPTSGLPDQSMKSAASPQPT
ncbi:serine/threonine protein kinase [Mycobacterium sp. URHB0021]